MDDKVDPEWALLWIRLREAIGHAAIQLNAWDTDETPETKQDRVNFLVAKLDGLAKRATDETKV